MKVVLIDGVEYEVGGDKHLAKLDADHKAAVKAANDRADAAEARADAEKKRADAAVAAISPDALDRAVAARHQLLTVAGSVLPNNYDTAGKSSGQVKRDALAAKHGESYADKSDAYVDVAFDFLAKEVKRDEAVYYSPTGSAGGAPIPNTGGPPQPKADLSNDDAFRAHLASKAKKGQE